MAKRKWKWRPTEKQIASREEAKQKWDLAKSILSGEYQPGYLPETTQRQRKFAELRQMTFDEYVGQQNSVKRLKAAIAASEDSNKALQHCAFIGPAGMGKTSLAACVADELGREALMTVGSALGNMEDVAALVDSVNGGIAFVDEAHDLAKAELPIVSGLLPLLEDFMLHTQTGSRPIVPFTMIFATTTFGLLDPAIRSRMGIPYELRDYTHEELVQIAQLHAARQGVVPLSEKVADEIARRCRGNPRMCGHLVQEINNFRIANNGRYVCLTDAMEAFETLGVDENGFNDTDWRLLELLKEKPCAISRCAGYVGMDKRTFEELVFPYLFKSGLIITSSRGLELTDKGVQLLAN